MTSPTPPHNSTIVRQPRRWRWLWLPVVLLAAYAIWQLPTWKAQAEVGAAYGARIGCSCRFVQGRDLASCATDLEPGMEAVSLSEIEGEQAVKASVPLLASRTARFKGASGCVLDNPE
ncbi:MAG: hypothetical protein ABL874_02320 [Sphingopyxis sp.]